MCEIVIVIVLCIVLHNKVKAKGRSSVGYIFLLIGLWIAGEIAGAILGVILTGGIGGGGEPELLPIMGCALAGAAVGAVATFIIVNSLSDVRDEEIPLRDRGFDDRDWREREDYRRRFAPGSERDDYSKEPPRQPENEDDRYKTE
jgi:hypothetical protein